jgi:hypothetical protein
MLDTLPDRGPATGEVATGEVATGEVANPTGGAPLGIPVRSYGWYGTPTTRNTYSGGTSNASDRRGSRVSTSSGMASL